MENQDEYYVDLQFTASGNSKEEALTNFKATVGAFLKEMSSWNLESLSNEEILERTGMYPNYSLFVEH